jgi:hypothetical protein
MKLTFLLSSSFLLSHCLNAAVLSGTGINLPIAGPHTALAPGVFHSTTVTGGTWTGTWAGPAAAAWIGTFNAVGPTTGSGMLGTTDYDFATLPTGTLPSGTLFLLGDVDSVVDDLDFRAWDSFGNLLDLWLNDTVATYANGTGPGGVPLINNLPGWTWDPVGKSYHIEGGGVSGANPNLGVVLESNQNIHTLEVIKPSFSYGFALRAPSTVPEPSSVLLAAVAGGLLTFRRKRKNLSIFTPKASPKDGQSARLA